MSLRFLVYVQLGQCWEKAFRKLQSLSHVFISMDWEILWGELDQHDVCKEAWACSVIGFVIIHWSVRSTQCLIDQSAYLISIVASLSTEGRSRRENLGASGFNSISAAGGEHFPQGLEINWGRETLLFLTERFDEGGFLLLSSVPLLPSLHTDGQWWKKILPEKVSQLKWWKSLIHV